VRPAGAFVFECRASSYERFRMCYVSWRGSDVGNDQQTGGVMRRNSKRRPVIRRKQQLRGIPASQRPLRGEPVLIRLRSGLTAPIKGALGRELAER
jgi:hypothetical protein